MSESAVGCCVSFYSKARSLQEIARLLTTARVLPSVVFTVAQWHADADAMVDRVLGELGASCPWIVRSSSLSEDGALFSNAGRFLSVPDVCTASGLKDAVTRVVASYGPGVSAQDEVLIQPMAQGLIASGVATTCDASSGLGYRIINITHQSRSDAVTSGYSSCAACVYLAPHRPPAEHPCHPVFDLLEELSALTAGLPIDVEFGLDAQGVVLFQLRRLTGVTPNGSLTAEARLKPHIDAAMTKARQLLEHDNGHGSTALGVMPDWNPAEMIGLKPRPLSFELYARLMTDRAWALGRTPFGYRDMSHMPLMHQVAGTPYIDIAASVQSLLPASLPCGSVRAVVTAVLDRLRAEPQLHDKMELTVLPTCLTPEIVTGSVPAFLEPARQAELVDGLRYVTREIVRHDGPVRGALQTVEAHLPMVELLNIQQATTIDAVSLVAIARDVLAPRFSLIARAAFVATAMLRSLEAIGAVRPGFFDAFARGIRTVSHDISRDATRLRTGDFLRRYGHVRPGTYDIRVPRYADDKLHYFGDRAEGSACPHVPIDPVEPIDLSPSQKRSAEKVIAELDVGISMCGLLDFSRRAIVGRELAKFVYSGYVSHTLEVIARAGDGAGFDRDSLSYLDLSSALSLVSTPVPDLAALQAVIERHRDGWQCGACIRVPYLLFDAHELLGFDEFHSQPNYVTAREVAGPVVTLKGGAAITAQDCAGAVVLMEAADPGHDWIFAAGIAGLITAFGGENSHMAIRSREFDIPAVIGVGGRQFAALSAGRALRINCAERRIEVLH